MAAAFADRTMAGRLLAEALMGFVNEPSPIVMALPRGGVPVGLEVAKALHAPLELCLVRKIGVPGHEELAAGAVTASGAMVLNESLMRSLGLSEALINSLALAEMAEIRRREKLYGTSYVGVGGKTVFVIDDGVATGATMRVACKALRREGPRRLIVAVPVAPQETSVALAGIADDVVCLLTPEPFWGVSHWYRDFSQLSDESVVESLDEARQFFRGARPNGAHDAHP